MSSQTFRLLLIVLISVTIGSFIGYKLGTNKVSYDWKNYQISVVNKEPPQNSTIDMAQFYTVLEKIQQEYYNKNAVQDPQKLVNSAIQGMVQSLGDPYTLYLPPTQNSNFKQNLAGQFTGIGAELGMQGKQIVVIAPLDGSPAEKAGVKTGDVITKVDGQATTGWDLNTTVNKIRGPKGTKVTLAVIHKGQSGEQQVPITRDVINVKSVDGWVKKVSDIKTVKVDNAGESKIAYIRLSQFGDQTNQEWSKLVAKLSGQITNDSSVKGLVLDLRNNPGGYLTDAVFIASEFLPQGDVVVQEQGPDGQKQSLTVTRNGTLESVSMVVLLNKGTASAAEIVSGALHDHGRAKLVGENSFGKGTVQQAEDLGEGAGLHVTVAKWLTPNSFWVGNGKDGTGLTPDYKVTLDPKDPTRDTQLEKAIQVLSQ